MSYQGGRDCPLYGVISHTTPQPMPLQFRFPPRLAVPYMLPFISITILSAFANVFGCKRLRISPVSTHSNREQTPHTDKSKRAVRLLENLVVGGCCEALNCLLIRAHTDVQKSRWLQGDSLAWRLSHEPTDPRPSCTSVQTSGTGITTGNHQPCRYRDGADGLWYGDFSQVKRFLRVAPPARRLFTIH